MNDFATHRLDGLESDNLLAFLALLGLLRALDEARPDWHPRAAWTIEDIPIRPILRVPEGVDKGAITAAIADGLDVLAQHHEFDGRKDLKLSPEEARSLLKASASTDRHEYVAELWAALVSDAAMTRDGSEAEPTPLCLMSGQGKQWFLERLALVPRLKSPPVRGKGRNKVRISEDECLQEALFKPWKRIDDKRCSFRWDPCEDVRYALRARNPTDSRTKDTVQHGANRLAAIGLSVLTVVPGAGRGRVRLAMLGGKRDNDGGFSFRWPIWREPISLACIRALLGHPDLASPESLASLDVVEIRQARRISSGRFSNFTRASSVVAEQTRDRPTVTV